MKKTAIIFSLMFVCALIFAQPNNSYNNNIIAPSPAAASLGKYGDIPVSYYTGVPNISIPIYTVSEGPLSLPISLSYHASGIKVQETASWVGLNWNLNAGGAVSRTVVGLKDEDDVGGWYYHGDEIPSPNDVCAFYDYAAEAAMGAKDSEPDIFSFDLGGYNGKFYLTNDNNAVNKVILVPKQDLIIHPRFTNNTAETAHLKGFIIITPDGNRFYFGDTGDGSPAIETLAGGGGDYPTIPSSWYLKKIETHDAKYAINLNYTDEDCSNDYIPSHSSCDFANGQGGSFPPNLSTHVKGKRISSITSTLDNVTFTPSVATREDVALHPFNFNPPKSLASISISTGAFQKKLDFTYDYWIDNSSDAVIGVANKRLRLQSVQEKSGDNTVIVPPHTFEYNIKAGSPNFLPHRLSRSIDHWGFYNGKSNGPYNSTQMNIGYQSATCINGGGTCNTHLYRFPGGSDRETDEISMKYGSLKKVNYPTGGYTEFDLEANDYYSTTSTTNTITLLNIPPASTCASFTVVGTPNPISFTASDLPSLKYELTLKSIACTPCPNQVSMEVKAYRHSDNVLIATSGQYQLNCSDPAGSGINHVGNLQTLFGNQLLSGVNYRFEIFFSRSSAQFKILKEVTYGPSNVKVGGLRVKQVKTHDGISALNDIIRNYEYRDSLIATQSSGILYEKPRYIHSYSYWAFGGNGCGSCSPSCACNVSGGCSVIAFDISVVPLSSFEGYHIGYKFVKELFPGNGYKTYTYQTENTVTYSGYPHPPAPARILAGNLKYSATRDNSSNVKAFEMHTPYGDAYSQSTATMFKTSQQCGNFLNLYYIRTRPYREERVTNSLDGIGTTSISTFDPTNRFLFPVSQKITNSDNKEFLTEFKYNHDYTTNTVVRDSLLARFIIAAPWKTSIKVSTIEVDGTELEYDFFNNATGVRQLPGVGVSPRIYNYYTFEKTWNSAGILTGNGKTLKATVGSYDAFGHRASFTAVNWPAETYTWGTNHHLTTVTYNGYTTEYEYYPGTIMLSKTKTANGSETWYDYDQLMRLLKVWDQPATPNTKTSAKVTTAYEYRSRNQTIPLNSFGENYIKTTTSYAAAPTGGGTSALTTQDVFQYSDGIGRRYQMVNRKQSPAQKDVVLINEYDNFGRETKNYNPVESVNNTGAKLSSTPPGTPFTLTEYFPDPISRIWKVTPPNWYATAYLYGANTTNEVLLDHTASTFYTPGSLVKTTITGPDNKILITYKDKNGRTILLRRTDTANSGPSNTYTIYDDKNRITKVIPPGSNYSSVSMNFDYTYDAANNIITKKKPDAAIVNLKYNNRDQLVLIQDGNLLALNKWNCLQYDDFGRVLKSGLFSGTIPSPITPALAPTELYTENIYGTVGIEKGQLKTAKSKVFDVAGTWLQTTYSYDIYGRVSSINGNNYLLPADLNAESTTYLYDFANNILKDTRISKKASSISYTLNQTHNYDHWGRITLNTHQVNGGLVHNISQLNYNWKNEMIEKNLGKPSSAADYLQSMDLTYNNMGWLNTMNAATLGGTNVGINSCPTAPVMPNPGAASNIPDNNDLFYLELKYDALQSGLSGTINKNGNISQAIWRVRGRERQSYSLTYDYLDRITGAQYRNLSDAQVTNNIDAWNENLSYDIRGNINSLTRTGKYKTSQSATCWTDGQIDNLAYTYNSNTNTLQKITDSAPAASKSNGWNNVVGAAPAAQYQYDANGGMVNDPYKNMAVTYNYLNLPSQITFSDPVNGPKVIYILYDGSGKKLRKTVMTNGVLEYQQDYVSGIEYTTTYTVLLSLEALYHSEGRVFNTNVGTTNADALRYEYSIRDHLGNTRLTFTDKNNNGVVDLNNTAGNEILQENHYYPFGLKIAGPWMDDIVAADTKYQYNGKGINTDFGLDWEDYGNRWYDPTCSRFHTTDKLSADFPSYSPYQYASNTPINAVDMDGLEAYYSPDGTFLKWGQISGANAPVVLILNAGNIWEPEEQEQLYIGGLPLTNFQFEQTAAFAYNETYEERELDRYRVANAIVNGYYFYIKNNPYKTDKSFQARLDQLRYGGDSHEDRMANISKMKGVKTVFYAVFMNMDIFARNQQPKAKSSAAAAINAFRREGIDYTRDFGGRRAVDWLGNPDGEGSNRFFWRETPNTEPHFKMGGFIHIDIVREKKKDTEKKKEKKKKKDDDKRA